MLHCICITNSSFYKDLERLPFDSIDLNEMAMLRKLTWKRFFFSTYISFLFFSLFFSATAQSTVDPEFLIPSKFSSPFCYSVKRGRWVRNQATRWTCWRKLKTLWTKLSYFPSRKNCG